MIELNSIRAKLQAAIKQSGMTRQQESSKAANALSIPLNKAGKYIFTIYATDAESNEMYYYDAENERKTFGTGDIWTMYDDEKSKSCVSSHS